MRTLAITDFKAHALQILGQVAETREPVLVTKRGKPLAEVIPFSPKTPCPGKLADALVFEKDIVAPLGEENAILLTKDKLIQQYSHVRTLW